MFKKCLILVFILSISFLGLSVKAQVRNTDIVVNIYPKNPSSNQNVTATLGSSFVDLNKANIRWILNGTEEIVGVGKKNFSFKTGEVGVSSNISIVIETIDGDNITKNISIIPSDLDMLWEANDSYAPPFYKGKKMVPPQGSFKVVAVPNLSNKGNKINIKNLSYVWKKDDAGQIGSSGWGKNYFNFDNSYLDKENNIEVAVSDITGDINTTSEITLKTTNPKILFYEKNIYLGTKWEKTLENGIIVDENGKNIIAEPFFFLPENIDSPSLKFDWFVNGEKIKNSNSKNTLSIKPNDGESGSAIIKVVIENTETLFQNMSKQIKVNF